MHLEYIFELNIGPLYYACLHCYVHLHSTNRLPLHLASIGRFLMFENSYSSSMKG